MPYRRECYGWWRKPEPNALTPTGLARDRRTCGQIFTAPSRSIEAQHVALGHSLDAMGNIGPERRTIEVLPLDPPRQPHAPARPDKQTQPAPEPVPAK
jgi:hypothetical protein